MEFYHPHKRFVYANVIGGLGSDWLLRFKKSQAVRAPPSVTLLHALEDNQGL